MYIKIFDKTSNLENSDTTSHDKFKIHESVSVLIIRFLMHQLPFSQIEQLRKASKFEDEIRMEQEERKREEEEKAERRAQFRQKAALFGN